MKPTIVTNVYDNDRRQLVGTADFYLTGSKQAKRAKIRRWMRE